MWERTLVMQGRHQGGPLLAEDVGTRKGAITPADYQCINTCSSRSVAILLGRQSVHRQGEGRQRSPDHKPEVEKRAVLVEGAQRRVVHAKEEVRLARLGGLAAVERSTHSTLCAVEELLVELGAARVVAQGDHAYWQGISGEQGCAHGDTLV